MGRAPLGQLGRAGSPGEPSMGLTPRLGQDTPSLAEAQTGSVYRMSALFPLPHPPLPLESWGLGEGQAGPEGAQEASKSRACPSVPLPFLARWSMSPFSSFMVSPSKHRWECAF